MKAMAKTPVKAKKGAANGGSRAATSKKPQPASKDKAGSPPKPAARLAAKSGAAKNGAQTAKNPRADKASTKASTKARKSDPSPASSKAPAKVKDPANGGAGAAKSAVKPRSDFAGKLVHMIAEEMAIEEAELTPSASLKDDLNLDAIDVAELLMQAEAKYNLTPFGEDDWESCETVSDFVILVQKRVEARRGKKAAKPAAKPGSRSKSK